MAVTGITILGLGPGEPELLTRQAWEVLDSIKEIYLRTRLHPTVAGLPGSLRIHSFDQLYEEGESFEAVYERIIERVLDLGQRPGGVVYAVPGHPFIAEATSLGIVRRARNLAIPVRIVEGISFIEPTFASLEIDPYPFTTLVDALELAAAHHPMFPPTIPALIAQMHSPAVASEVKLTLMSVYPDEHEVKLVHGAGTTKSKVETIPLFQIDRSRNIHGLTVLYLPPLAPDASFEAFQEIIAHLRAPEGCPWDRDQTHQTLRPHLLEESYEVLAALDADDDLALREELGDLLLQIVLHAQIANENGEFSMEDVLRGIHAKLIRRHPHVFGDLKIRDKEGVIENWERLKASEKLESGKVPGSLLDGVAQNLPALAQAQAIQERVARVGFDWGSVKGVFDKIIEEVVEVQKATGPDDREVEIGDLIFSVVNLARWLNVDAESALRSANTRFQRRFTRIEEAARKEGRQLSDLTLDEMDALWNQAKRA
jgi:tetrapyrrole methylase family protein/MazG family protein